LGTTVSRFNADIDYAALKSRQIRFVYVKASQGETIVDAGMEQNVREANKNEMLIGLYHLFEPKADPIKQAENFVAQLKKQKWDLPPVVDCEIFNGQLPQDYSDRVFQFIQRLQGLTNEKPIIYANTPFADQHFDKRFSTYPIFLARFITSSTSTSIPIPPKWWTTVTFWHLTESVNDPVLSHLDIVAFKGNGAGLKALLADNRVVQPAN
jgi:lysozyme